MSPHVSRRSVLLGAGALGAAAGIGATADLGLHAAQHRDASSAAMRIGYLPITDAAPLLVAHGSGLLDEHGTGAQRPVKFRSWASLAEAFLTRQVDVVHLLMPFAVQLRYAMGTACRVLAWNHTNGSALTVHRDIDRIEQLAGRKVAIPFWWSIHNIVLQRMLRAAGLTPVVRRQPSAEDGTVELVVMSPSDMVPALDNGSVGGFIVADPFNAIAEIKGVGRILRFVGDVWRDHACCVVLAHEDFLRAAPDRVQGLVDALALSQLGLARDRRAGARALTGGHYLPQPLKAVTKALNYPAAEYVERGALRHADWSGQRIGFQPFPFPGFTAELVASMRDTVVDGDTGFLTGIRPDEVHGQLVDDRFVRNSLNRFGGPGAFGLPDALLRSEEVNPA
ncbi:ABC transporter substrate-binding protein [Saccharopolyspora gloriosae]|uniref:ABC transporter substrate-binding protein n=1 Tax=Saccharopolyspora gloriosae TaxID=455344 RepID=UPI001FB5C1AD|nr:ABC transporter substrate-binding protein [Saccharopolyspora gloriosae]